MPRTKVTKNTKRNRDQSQDELLQNYLREFDEDVARMTAAMENEYANNLQAIENEMQRINSLIPEEVLNMKMSDIMALNVPTLLQVKDLLSVNQAEAISTTHGQSSTLEQKESKDDEGYLTEGRSSENATTITSAATGSVIRGPLSSARAKMRRSKSAGMIPSLPRMMPQQQRSRLKPPTPLKGSQTEHKSRTAYRTPLQPPKRIKASSADRIDKIMPKTPIDDSLALLRFPRVGETLVSLTGSPVAGFSGSMEPIASVNIPTSDGVLSLRPTATENFDSNILSQIDDDTYANLQQLHKNIAKIMELNKLSKKNNGK